MHMNTCIQYEIMHENKSMKQESMILVLIYGINWALCMVPSNNLISQPPKGGGGVSDYIFKVSPN